jgi:glycosyltransferase involved in cell wall biosynthesis
MIVTVDISPIVYGVGVSRYTANLARALAKQPDVTLKLFGNSLRQKDKLHAFAEEIKVSKKLRNFHSLSPKMLSLLWYKFGHPSFEFLADSTNVFHSWEELIPPVKKTPLVVTIHDLAWLKYPDTVHPSTRYKHAQAWKRLNQLGAHVIAVSQSTKEDILEQLEFPKDRLHLVYEALPVESERKISEKDLSSVKEKFKLDKPYVFFIGTREPRKNLDRFVDAWAPLHKEVDLVIAGGAGWQKSNKAPTGSAAPKVIGRVSDHELATLYTGARALAYPSLYEGFGLPILEAFYHQTPVLTSNVSSMSEIAGDAAVLVNPFDVEGMQKGLEQLLNESSTEREKRQRKMKKRLADFSWESTAKQTVTVYKKAVESKKK